MKLSLIIPAYNEEERIAPALAAYIAYFEARYGDEVELIVVVNGSTDRTADVVRGFAAMHPLLRLIVEPRRVGKGGAIMRGMRAASGGVVGFTDADGSTPPVAFEALVERCADAACVIASRWAPGSDVKPRQPWSRRIASRVFNGLVNRLFDLRLTDTQCGAKVLSRQAVDDVLPVLGLTQWAFDVDLLFQLRRAGHPILEIPTIWHDVKGSKINIPVAALQMTLAITRLRLLYSPFRFVVSIYDRSIGRLARTVRRRECRERPSANAEWTNGGDADIVDR